MDTTSIIELIVAIFVVLIFIKFIVSPFIKIILGIIIFLFLLYLLQRLFGFNIDSALAPFGIHSNLNQWVIKSNWIFGPVNYYIDQVKIFANSIWNNFPKSLNQ